MLLLNLMLVFGSLHAVVSQCDFHQFVPDGEFYDIKSPYYPNSYRGVSYCQWNAETYEGSRLKLSCGIFNIPWSQSCTRDRVSISLTGDRSLSDGRPYCGTGTFTLISSTNQLSMALIAPRDSQGGRFFCNITAIPTVTTTTPAPTCKCGIKKQTRIVGGSETGVNEFPMMSGLIDKRRRIVYCGSTISSAYYVLTAAHCLYRRNVNDVAILVGDHNTTSATETNSAQLYVVEKFIMHPQYNFSNNMNDIALVKVVGPIIMSREVMPACLPFRLAAYDFENATVTVLGWGSTEFAGSMSDVLMKADLKVLSRPQCRNSQEGITDKQMCTFREGRDSCQSDSGGPVLWQSSQNALVYLVGIISFGEACATSKPAINTRATSYLQWIYDNTPGENYCYV